MILFPLLDDSFTIQHYKVLGWTVSILFTATILIEIATLLICTCSEKARSNKVSSEEKVIENLKMIGATTKSRSRKKILVIRTPSPQFDTPYTKKSPRSPVRDKPIRAKSRLMEWYNKPINKDLKEKSERSRSP
jgi:hypothetical protein